MSFKQYLEPTRDLSIINITHDPKSPDFLDKYVLGESDSFSVLKTHLELFRNIEAHLILLVKNKDRYFVFEIPVSNETGNPALKISIEGLNEDFFKKGLENYEQAYTEFERLKCL